MKPTIAFNMRPQTEPWGGGNWWVSLNSGNNSFKAPVRWDAWYEAAGWSSVMAGDFNGDGKMDIIGRDSYGEWWVDVVGYDAFQFLSTLSTLLAVRGLSIVEGRVFTSQPPREPARRPR